jgi:hypothetical protein
MKRRKRRPYSRKDWAEVAIIFGFLSISVIVLGFVGALMMELIFRLL